MAESYPATALQQFITTLNNPLFQLPDIGPVARPQGQQSRVLLETAVAAGIIFQLFRHFQTTEAQGGPAVTFVVYCKAASYSGTVFVRFHPGQLPGAEACRRALVRGLKQLKEDEVFMVDSWICKSC